MFRVALVVFSMAMVAATLWVLTSSPHTACDSLIPKTFNQFDHQHDHFDNHHDPYDHHHDQLDHYHN